MSSYVICKSEEVIIIENARIDNDSMSLEQAARSPLRQAAIRYVVLKITTEAKLIVVL